MLNSKVGDIEFQLPARHTTSNGYSSLDTTYKGLSLASFYSHSVKIFIFYAFLSLRNHVLLQARLSPYLLSRLLSRRLRGMCYNIVLL